MINKRIRDLRKHEKLTQEAFGAKISVKGNTIAQWESGRNAPSDSSIKFICQVFKVNEEWLRHGIGKMKVESPPSTLDILVSEYHLDNSSRVAIDKFINLSPELRTGIIAYFTDVVDSIRNNSPAENPISSPDFNHAAAEAAYEKKYGNALPKGYTVSNTTGATESPENQANKENIG